MKLLFLNLPHQDRIVRRYMCSYNSPIYLFPPYELLQLAACVKAWNGAEVVLLDAVAEGENLEQVSDFISRVQPDFVVSMTGIECIETDLACIDRLKSEHSKTTFIAFGYYPTIFSEQVFSSCAVDIILRNEPEESLVAYLAAVKNKQDIKQIAGIAFRGSDGGVVVNAEKRITDLDHLPLIDYSLIDIKKYSEMLLGGPLGVIQSARGCPFLCNYCITSHGRKVIYKSAARVIRELRHLVSSGVRIIRFIDDTFTVNKKRVEEICQGILREGIKVRWSCLSRADTLDENMLDLMKRCGCVRIYVGIESYSQKVCDEFKKGYDCRLINEKLRLIRKMGLESIGFVIVGSPFEQPDDFSCTLKGALSSSLDLIIATTLVPYPGTPLYEQMKDRISFKLIPYQSRFKDDRSKHELIALEKELYWKFYFRPVQILRLVRIGMHSPYQSLRLLISFLAFLLKPRKENEHPDFL
ncbi:MAG: radical SAM protein [Candidatus Omnitrophica bacterium]|nr:radical SAM protein [Candidatus Omnitrophota bacterium]